MQYPLISQLQLHLTSKQQLRVQLQILGFSQAQLQVNLQAQHINHLHVLQLQLQAQMEILDLAQLQVRLPMMVKGRHNCKRKWNDDWRRWQLHLQVQMEILFQAQPEVQLQTMVYGSNNRNCDHNCIHMPYYCISLLPFANVKLKACSSVQISFSSQCWQSGWVGHPGSIHANFGIVISQDYGTVSFECQVRAGIDLL